MTKYVEIAITRRPFPSHTPTKCKYCKKEFATPGIAKIHEENKHLNTKHQCPKCESYFTQANNLRTHMNNATACKKRRRARDEKQSQSQRQQQERESGSASHHAPASQHHSGASGSGAPLPPQPPPLPSQPLSRAGGSGSRPPLHPHAGSRSGQPVPPLTSQHSGSSGQASTPGSSVPISSLLNPPSSFNGFGAGRRFTHTPSTKLPSPLRHQASTSGHHGSSQHGAGNGGDNGGGNGGGNGGSSSRDLRKTKSHHHGSSHERR